MRVSLTEPTTTRKPIPLEKSKNHTFSTSLAEQEFFDSRSPCAQQPSAPQSYTGPPQRISQQSYPILPQHAPQQSHPTVQQRPYASPSIQITSVPHTFFRGVHKPMPFQLLIHPGSSVLCQCHYHNCSHSC